MGRVNNNGSWTLSRTNSTNLIKPMPEVDANVNADADADADADESRVTHHSLINKKIFHISRYQN